MLQFKMNKHSTIVVLFSVLSITYAQANGFYLISSTSNFKHLTNNINIVESQSSDSDAETSLTPSSTQSGEFSSHTNIPPATLQAFNKELRILAANIPYYQFTLQNIKEALPLNKEQAWQIRELGIGYQWHTIFPLDFDGKISVQRSQRLDQWNVDATPSVKLYFPLTATILPYLKVGKLFHLTNKIAPIASFADVPWHDINKRILQKTFSDHWREATTIGGTGFVWRWTKRLNLDVCIEGHAQKNASHNQTNSHALTYLLKLGCNFHL